MSKIAECPECGDELTLADDLMQSEILQCESCGAELEVESLEPLVLVAAPEEEEDWGE